MNPTLTHKEKAIEQAVSFEFFDIEEFYNEDSLSHFKTIAEYATGILQMAFPNSDVLIAESEVQDHWLRNA